MTDRDGMSDATLRLLLRVMEDGSDAEDLIRKAFFPRSAAALNDRDVSSLELALPVEEAAFMVLVGRDRCGILTTRYSMGLRRIRATGGLR